MAGNYYTRALHLIDLENLVGGPNAPDELIRRVWACYAHGVPRRKDDQVRVGSSRLFASRSWWMLPTWVSRYARDGKDGGEQVILDSIDLHYVSDRFGKIVIASGDGAFTQLASDARTMGIHVHQVTGLGLASKRLREAAHTRSKLRVPSLWNPAAVRSLIPTLEPKVLDQAG